MQQMSSSWRWTRGPVLGRGSTATVSLATSTSTTFAVKSADFHSSAPLQREQRLLSSIPPSPHLISYLGFDLTCEGGNSSRTLFNLFLEYAPGGSLSDHIACGGLEKEHEIRRYTRGVLMGLSHLHSLGVAHCDVKPRNVLLAADGSAKLADFGCARWADSGAGEDHPAAGTPQFMSPEAARGEAQGTAADIWALGCTVIEMATGRPPWPGVRDAVSAVHRIGFSGESPEIPASVSVEAQEFIGKCLERDPRRRPTADELLRHPIVVPVSTSSDMSTCSPETIWRSPKCVLDHNMWDSLDGEREEKAATLAVAKFDPSERIQRLTVEEVSPSVSSWDDDGDWITIRHTSVAGGGQYDPSEKKRGSVGVLNAKNGHTSFPNCEGYDCDLVVDLCELYSKQVFSLSYVSVPLLLRYPPLTINYPWVNFNLIP